jgi:hypothetical protein
MNTNQAGKGDKPRPVNKSIFNDNYEQICWNGEKKPNSIENNNSLDREFKRVKGKLVYKY